MRVFSRESIGIIGALLLSLSVACSREKPKKPAPAPAPVAVPERPPVEAPVEEVVAAAEKADTIKAALLGLNRKDESADEVSEPEPPKRRARRVARRSSSTDGAGLDGPAAAPDLSDYAFQEAVNSWRGMRTCLARSTLRGTAKRGAMKVAFKIRGDGSVSNCKVVETSNAVADSIAPCVVRSARRIRFPAFGGEEVEKQAKFVF